MPETHPIVDWPDHKLLRRDAVHQYFERQDELWDQVRKSAAPNLNLVSQRLRALKAVSGSKAP